MPRFYFDLRDGDDLAIDEEGLELPNVGAVQAEAAISLADMARDAVHGAPLLGGGRRMAIEVRDEAGPVMQVRFSFDVETRTH
ncbi:DUF6894 family protein [Bradyrhizobium cosmicum]|uniref:DUF6894 family protein n=1 Tax=Bradyrhizobium cosmicum TaxID=1404864 RepID=UPI0028F0C0E4|nr:hypothetical protein [Bradyrhizobium cosmicum]